jgi:hypothetical protein
MADLPSLAPGCMVAWFDRNDKPCYALVVQVEEYFEAQCYVASVIEGGRIRTLSLFKGDLGGRWCVLRHAL